MAFRTNTNKIERCVITRLVVAMVNVIRNRTVPTNKTGAIIAEYNNRSYYIAPCWVVSFFHAGIKKTKSRYFNVSGPA